jgi:urease accessory protein
MLEIKAKIKARRGAYKVETRGTLRLPFDLRRTAGVRATLVSGEEVAVKLPRGEILRGGDLVVASDGRIIEVLAETERVLNVECESPAALARCAYELGSRHVAVETGDGWLRVAADHELEHVLQGFGAKLTPMDAPFEPESGAAAAGHSHDAGEHAHSHDHEHSHACGHDHGDEHAHDHDHEHDHDHAHCGHPHHGRRK